MTGLRGLVEAYDLPGDPAEFVMAERVLQRIGRDVALWAADAADFMAAIESEFSELQGADWFERDWHALLARFAVIQARAQEEDA